MKTSRSVPPLSAPILALGSALCFGFLTPANKVWSASAQVTSPNGSYGVLVNEWKGSHSNTVRGFLSALNFDGAGNVSGPFIFITINDTVISGRMTGTYSGNPDGTNTISLTRDGGGTFTASMTVTDGGAGIQLLMTGGGLLGPGQVITGSGRVQSALGTTPAGSYAIQLNQWPDANHEPLGIFGVINLDGVGNVTGSLTAVGPDAGPAPISTTFLGTYSVKPDGTGSMILNLDIGVTATFAIVVTDGGSRILILQTDESDGFSSVVSGTAQKQ